MLEKFERYPLTFGPTPIEKLSRLSEHLGGEVELFAKREDCNSGLAFGGKKVRKLEYIVPDEIAAGADTLVTIGGVQSNHTRQVAAVAAKLGMKCRLVQESWVPFEDAVYDRVGNILMSRVMGADIDLVDEGFDIGIRESWERAIQDVKDRGGRPYAIPAGASVHKFGGLGFVGFAEEVRQQESEMDIKFDYIVVCTVTGSTHAGHDRPRTERLFPGWLQSSLRAPGRCTGNQRIQLYLQEWLKGVSRYRSSGFFPVASRRQRPS